MIPHVGGDDAASFWALPRLSSCWKVSNNPKTTTTQLEDWHDVIRITERIEQAIKMGKIEGSTKDSKIIMIDELGYDSKGGKP